MFVLVVVGFVVCRLGWCGVLLCLQQLTQTFVKLIPEKFTALAVPSQALIASAAVAAAVAPAAEATVAAPEEIADSDTDLNDWRYDIWTDSWRNIDDEVAARVP